MSKWSLKSVTLNSANLRLTQPVNCLIMSGCEDQRLPCPAVITSGFRYPISPVDTSLKDTLRRRRRRRKRGGGEGEEDEEERGEGEDEKMKHEKKKKKRRRQTKNGVLFEENRKKTIR